MKLLAPLRDGIIEKMDKIYRDTNLDVDIYVSI
jgi:hypothetical protein